MTSPPAGSHGPAVCAPHVGVCGDAGAEPAPYVACGLLDLCLMSAAVLRRRRAERIAGEPVVVGDIDTHGVGKGEVAGWS